MSEDTKEKAKWVKQVTRGQYTAHFSEKGYFKLTSPDLRGGDKVHVMFSGAALQSLIDASECISAAEEVYRTEIATLKAQSKAAQYAKIEALKTLDKQIKFQQANIEAIRLVLPADSPAVVNMTSQLNELVKARALAS